MKERRYSVYVYDYEIDERGNKDLKSEVIHSIMLADEAHARTFLDDEAPELAGALVREARG